MRIAKHASTRLSPAAFVAATLCQPSAFAQVSMQQAAPQPDQLQEIVVTAQKRAEKAQDVGISIEALSGEQLRQLGAVQVSDLARLTPGADLAGSFAGQYLFFSIRGVSQQDFSSTAEGPNAVYIDDGYIGINNVSAIGLFDIDHSEVLKGPQGTLFGRNAVELPQSDPAIS
jgi:iron complex outermembrane recepter protein